MIVDIPTDEEISEMEDVGLSTVLRRVVRHWGMVNVIIA